MNRKFKSTLKSLIKEILFKESEDDVIQITFEERMNSNEFHPLLHKALGESGIRKLEDKQNKLSDIREAAEDYGRDLPRRFLDSVNALQNWLVKSLKKAGIEAEPGEGDDLNIEIYIK